MEYIADYQPKHYSYFLKKCEKLIEECKDIDCWAKNITEDDNILWIKTVKSFKNDLPEFAFESSMLITLVIALFILELDVQDNQVELTNSEIEKLILRFEKIMRKEFGYKHLKINRNGHTYTLLKDIE